MRTSRSAENALLHPEIRASKGVWSKAPLGFVVKNVWKLALVISCLLATSAQAQYFAYVTNSGSSSVSVVDTATNRVKATIGVGARPIGVAFTPNGSRAYVANSESNSVSVINTATNAVIATIAVGSFPQGLAITPNGSRAYVANLNSNSVSVIDTASNTVTATITFGSGVGGLGAA